MAENSGYCVEFDNYAIPQALGSSGYVGFCMQVAEMKVYNVKIRDLNSDYSYTSDFEKRSKTESTWGFSVGNATINYADSIYTYTPAKNPSAYIINNVNFKNYEMQVELSFDAQWGGIVYRNNGSNNGFYSIRETSQYLSYYKSGWGDQVQAEAGYSNYAFGSRIRIKVTMNNNHLTIATMLVGVDEDFITTINNLDLSTVYDGALGTSGGVGIVSRSGAIMQIYDFSVVDKDTNLVYHLPQNETASWTNTIGDIGVDQTSDEVTGEEKLELYQHKYQTKNKNYHPEQYHGIAHLSAAFLS